MEKSVAIILAAGRGKRMQAEVAKQFLLLQGEPILYHTLKAFEASCVDEIILVTGKDDLEIVKEIVDRGGFCKVAAVTIGGAERYDSVYEGLKCVKDAKYVLVHDGARPLISTEMIQRNIEALKTDKAVVTAVPSKDTIKISDEKGYVQDTPNRKFVWNIQTPQSFHTSLIKEAYEKMYLERENLLSAGINITDDAMVVETFMNVPIKLILGDYRNIKITTPEDLCVAEGLMHK